MVSAHQVLPQFVWVRDLRHHRSEAGKIFVARPSPRVRCATHLANGGNTKPRKERTSNIYRVCPINNMSLRLQRTGNRSAQIPSSVKTQKRTSIVEPPTPRTDHRLFLYT